MTIAATVATVSTAHFRRCRIYTAKNNAQPTLHRCQLTAGYPTLSLPRNSVGSDSAAASIRRADCEAHDRRVACALLGVLTVRPSPNRSGNGGVTGFRFTINTATMPTAIRDSDLEILRYCHELRFCTIDHLTSLTGRHRQAINLRLSQLIAEKYIYRNKFPNPNQKHVYSIGNQGFTQLAYHGLIDLNDVPARLRTNELKPLFLSHALLVTDIHAGLILDSRDGRYRLTDWREGKQLYDSVTFYENGKKKRLPVCPDAFFTIEKNGDPKTRLSYALEADRGTTTRRTFEDKINAYWRFLEQNRQVKSYGVKWFRVVTVTLTDARAASLSQLAAQTLPKRIKKYFLTSSWQHFSIESLDAILPHE